MCLNGTERRVMTKLLEWFGRGRVDQVISVEPGIWRARLTDGSLAYATAAEDGTITIDEPEVVC